MEPELLKDLLKWPPNNTMYDLLWIYTCCLNNTLEEALEEVLLHISYVIEIVFPLIALPILYSINNKNFPLNIPLCLKCTNPFPQSTTGLFKSLGNPTLFRLLTRSFPL